MDNQIVEYQGQATEKFTEQDRVLEVVKSSLTELSFSKMIELPQGTLAVWDKLVREDLEAKKFDLDDFEEAVNNSIRSKVYNRIDYADIYEEARKIKKDREKPLRQDSNNYILVDGELVFKGDL